jgi:hypothetical protein
MLEYNVFVGLNALFLAPAAVLAAAALLMLTRLLKDLAA